MLLPHFAVSDNPLSTDLFPNVRVARINGQFVINLPLSNWSKPIWIEWWARLWKTSYGGRRNDEVSEQDLLEAMKAAHEAIKIQCKAQMELAEE